MLSIFSKTHRFDFLLEKSEYEKDKGTLNAQNPWNQSVKTHWPSLIISALINKRPNYSTLLTVSIELKHLKPNSLKLLHIHFFVSISDMLINLILKLNGKQL